MQAMPTRDRCLLIIVSLVILSSKVDAKEEIAASSTDTPERAANFGSDTRRAVNNAEADRYNAISILQCAAGMVNATLVGDGQTAITVAHVFSQADFYQPNTLSTCFLTVQNPQHRILDVIRLRRVIFRKAFSEGPIGWGDDIAVVSLERAPDLPGYSLHVLPIESSKSQPRTLRLIGYQMVLESYIKVESEGQVIASDVDWSLVKHNAYSTPGSSGALLIDDKTGAAIGLNVGSHIVDSSPQRFGANWSYNRGLRFDRQLTADIQTSIQFNECMRSSTPFWESAYNWLFDRPNDIERCLL